MKKILKTIKNNKNYTLFAILIIMFLLILALNRRTLYISDDFLYKFEFRPGMSSDVELRPVDGFFSLLRSQYHHYSLWNGRFVAHTIVQFFLQFDKWVFNIFNSIIYLLLGWLILRIGCFVTNKKTSILTLVMIYILMFLTIPNFGQTVLWISGAGNYLWMSVIYLGFYYFNIILKEDSLKTIIVSIILGFLAGATNENTGPATILMVALIAMYQIYKSKRVNIWRITGIISSLIGFSLILFAPAATKRVEERNEVSMTLGSIIENLDFITQYIIDHYLIYLMVILLLFLILFKSGRITEKITLNIIVLSAGFLGATYSLAVVDGVIERTMFGPVVFLITITTILLSEFFDYLRETKLLLAFIVPLLLLFIYVYNYAFIDVDETYNQVANQYDIILNNPNKNVEVPMITTPETDYNAYSNGTNYLREDSDTWLNEWAARFFGVESIGGYRRE